MLATPVIADLNQDGIIEELLVPVSYYFDTALYRYYMETSLFCIFSFYNVKYFRLQKLKIQKQEHTGNSQTPESFSNETGHSMTICIQETLLLIDRARIFCFLRHRNMHGTVRDR